jgi:hypothetical protein
MIGSNAQVIPNVVKHLDCVFYLQYTTGILAVSWDAQTNKCYAVSTSYSLDLVYGTSYQTTYIKVRTPCRLHLCSAVYSAHSCTYVWKCPIKMNRWLYVNDGLRSPYVCNGVCSVWHCTHM